MKLIAFILDATSIHRILSQIGEENEPAQMHPARGPPNEFTVKRVKLLNINTIKLSVGENGLSHENRKRFNE